MTRRSAAILGGGIMGAATALHLARRGLSVTLFEREAEPFGGASRWNEGRIHLGFVYAGDPSLATARALVPGGLDFGRQVEQLTGAALDGATTEADDVILIHRDSVTDAATAQRYYERVAELVRSHDSARGYLADVSACKVERLTPADLGAMANTDAVLAGFRIPERSVDTNRVADAFIDALGHEPTIELACGHRVDGVSETRDGSWRVDAAGEQHGPFDAVVNALWEGRPRIDRALGHRPDRDQQHRYRVSLFVRTRVPLVVPSALVAVGPYGDLKSYTERYFCASWYPAGLLGRSESAEAPATPHPSPADRRRIADAAFRELGAILPGAREVRDAAEEVRVEGGWVYSQGSGLLDDPDATVHQRWRHGVSRRGTYFSVDTGKYSVAPTLAEQVARDVCAAAGCA